MAQDFFSQFQPGQALENVAALAMKKFDIENAAQRLKMESDKWDMEKNAFLERKKAIDIVRQGILSSLPQETPALPGQTAPKFSVRNALLKAMGGGAVDLDKGFGELMKDTESKGFDYYIDKNDPTKGITLPKGSPHPGGNYIMESLYGKGEKADNPEELAKKSLRDKLKLSGENREPTTEELIQEMGRIKKIGSEEKTKSKEQLTFGALKETLGRAPTDTEVKAQLEADEVKADKDINKFKVLFPEMVGKEGTPEFASKYTQWYRNFTKTTFMERASTGQVQVGTPEQQEADVRAIMNNQQTIADVTKAGGMGGAGGAYGRQIRTEILKRQPNFNFKLQEMSVKGDQSEISQAQGMRGKILSFEQTAIQNSKQVYQLADRIDVSKIPLLNSLILKGETSLAGDPVASSYMLAWRTFVNEYARVSTSATGGGVTTDSARKEMEDVIRKSNTPEMIKSGMRQAVLEMKHREYGYDVQLKSVYDRWGGRANWKAELPTAEDIYQIFETPGPYVVPQQNKGGIDTWETLKKKKKW